MFKKGIFTDDKSINNSFFFLSSEEEDVCVCNRPASDQHKKDHENKDAKWDMIHNTYEELNPAHGRLFNGALVRFKKMFFSVCLLINID